MEAKNIKISSTMLLPSPPTNKCSRYHIIPVDTRYIKEYWLIKIGG